MSGKNNKNIKYKCSNCGAETLKWMGRCPQCGEWNTLEEKIEVSAPKNIRISGAETISKAPVSLSKINLSNHNRIKLGLSEVDRRHVFPCASRRRSGSVILAKSAVSLLEHMGLHLILQISVQGYGENRAWSLQKSGKSSSWLILRPIFWKDRGGMLYLFSDDVYLNRRSAGHFMYNKKILQPADLSQLNQRFLKKEKSTPSRPCRFR